MNLTDINKTVKTTCPYCGVGCGVLATPQTDGSVEIKGDPDHPANFGRLCSKGSALGETLDLEDRQFFPEIGGKRATWDQALSTIAHSFRTAIDTYGPDSVAIYGSGQLLTEDYYVANKLMKGFVGTGNIDTNSRLCMASSVAGHKRAFGSDTVPGCYEDLEQADLLILVGSNLAWCHPVIYQRIAAAKKNNPNMRIVLIDPRRTMTADIADLHLAVASDGDAALFVGLLGELVRKNILDNTYIDLHTQGFDAASAIASKLSINDVALHSGCKIEDVATFFDWFLNTEKSVTVYSQGVNQSAAGTDKVNAIINCHLATGRIGKPGMGPFSITGQPNAMGGREVGGLANTLAAHMDFANPDHHDKVSRFWGTSNLAEKPGLKAVDLFRAIDAGKIKAVWIMATNPVDSMPEADRVRAALRKCELVVVSDMSSTTDTMACADIKLPAIGWGEKDGTVTNSERRISRQRAFLPAPKKARPDWWMICEVAKRLGFEDAFSFKNPAEIFAEHAALSTFENDGSRDFDLSALSDLSPEQFNSLTPRQWPANGKSNQRLFADGHFFTPTQKANFIAVVPPKQKEAAPGKFILNTGRIRDHWHTMTRTGKTPRLSAHYAEPFAELHPADAQELRIKTADIVALKNTHGRILVRALVTDRQKRGHTFVPMHWTDQFAAKARVDTLVSSKTDPFSGQPALKMSEVEITKAAPEWHAFLTCQEMPDVANIDYWALAKTEGGLRLELAGTNTPTDWSAWVKNRFGLDESAQLLSVLDKKSGKYNFALFKDGKVVFALFISKEPTALSRQWAVSQLKENYADRQKTTLLAGRPGADQPDTGAIICACYAVGINTIVDAVTKDGLHTVEQIGSALKAGTNCGSCRSEIRGIIDANRLATAE